MRKPFIWFHQFFLFIILSSFSHQPTNQFELSVCMIFHNEASWLREWIEYHQLVGVQHFFLYNNRSIDHFEEVLDEYIQKGIVTLTDWPYGNEKNYISLAQIPAYQHALTQFGYQTKWMAFIDSDEFIVPVIENSIREVLKDYDHFGGLVVNWQVFGTSSVFKIQPDELMIEKLTWMSLPDHPMNLFYKTILRTDRVDALNCNIRSCNMHSFPYLKDYYAVNSLGVPPTSDLLSTVCIERIQINHYRTRDQEYLNTIKIPRLRAWCEASKKIIDKLENDLHGVQSDTILRFVPPLKERMRQTQD